MQALRFPAATLLLALPLLAGASDAADWLLKMGEAARTANYVGSVYYSGDEVSESFRVTHRFQNGQERERVQSLSGEPREIEKQGDKTICLMPQSRRVELPTPKGLFPGLTRERVQQVAQVYSFTDLGEDRVAGRICRGVAIQPRDSYRYGYQVWADVQTALPLKMELRDERGRVLERMEFTQIEFPASIPDSAFAAEPSAPPAPPPPPAPPLVAMPFDGQLPPGFRVTLRDVRVVQGKGRVEHWLLSDGLTAISVFSSQHSARGFRGLSRIGALNVYGRTSGKRHITVLGEVPEQTLRQVGDGLDADASAGTPAE